jgi:hypothetical protein
MEQHVSEEEEERGHRHEIRLHIDRKPHVVRKEQMTGAELRALAGIPADYDLWEEVTGPHEDRNVKDDHVVHLRQDMHFYSCKQTINPGGEDAAA